MSTVPEKPRSVSSYDWETGATTYDVTQMDAATRFRCAISQAVEAARKRFPHSTDRIERAYELVHAGKVVLHPRAGTATVQSSDGTQAYTVNGVCSCPDAPTKAPEGYCKHKLSVVILRKALLLLDDWKKATAPVTVTPQALDTDAVEAMTEAAPESVPVQDVEAEPAVCAIPVTTQDIPGWGIPPSLTIPAAFVITIQGKHFVLFAGLLFLAHQQGLLSLTEEVTHITDTYVMAAARAEFHDGRVFRGVGDSTPDNVGKTVKPHWRRLAGTRAMARCLRNALNINMVALEELD